MIQRFLFINLDAGCQHCMSPEQNKDINHLLWAKEKCQVRFFDRMYLIGKDLGWDPELPRNPVSGAGVCVANTQTLWNAVHKMSSAQGGE